jgi:hypothetical protein
VFLLAHESASSSAANRFIAPASTSLELGPSAIAFAVYDNTSSRWRLGGSVAPTGPAGATGPSGGPTGPTGPSGGPTGPTGPVGGGGLPGVVAFLLS